MPVNTELADKIWLRYAYCRDNGHTKFVEKADKCDRFFIGDQWDPTDRALLEANRRPVLTINKIISTVSNVMGEQIYNRAETTFRPRAKASAETADVLSKVYKQISDNNQLDWKRSDLFADGIIRSRGFLDVRIEYGDNAQGEVKIENLNSKNVIIDPDGEEYDPDTWGDVFTSKWVTPDDIEVLYSKADADLLRSKGGGTFEYGYDSVQNSRERFGDSLTHPSPTSHDEPGTARTVRLIERQYRQLDRQKHFLSPTTGDMRSVPDSFDPDRVAYFTRVYGFRVISKLVRRIRWTVVADNIVLHDDWSPYKHLSVVPYFPYFRYGTTVGLVENLMGSQELLNKVSSQELHVVNTTANSGYKVKAGALTNMTVAELEQKGAQTGLVIEVNGDPDKDVQKITPNAVPSGLDRISYKAEEHIKTISGVSDSMQGFDREDVAAKAIQAKRQAGNTNLVKPMDSLTRSDYILARNVIDLVQEFYTEPRIMTITKDEATGETETFEVNTPNEDGSILNDLTMGEYGVVVSSVPRRETMEDSQFEQAVSLREMGIALPDSVLIDSSRLVGKKDIIKQMEAANQSPEALARKELEQRGMSAEVAKTEAETSQKAADTTLKHAKAQETTVKAQVLANTPITDPSAQQGDPELERAQAEHEADIAERELAHKERMDLMEHSRKERETSDKLRLQAQDMAQKRMDERVKAAREAATAAAEPPATTQVANRSRLPTSKA